MQEIARWMARSPIQGRPGDSAAEALDLMVDGDVRHLPVVDESGELAGILSIDDLRAGLPFDVGLDVILGGPQRAEARRHVIGDLMTHFPTCVHPDTPVAEAVQMLIADRIGALPVIDRSGKLVGIFSESDALRAFLSLLAAGETVSDLRPERPRPAQCAIEALAVERARIAEQLARCRGTERELAEARHGEPHPAERGWLTEEGEREAALVERTARRLDEIDGALARHAQGRFGICTACGGDIPSARLRALPSARHCLRCARAGQSPHAPA